MPNFFQSNEYLNAVKRVKVRLEQASAQNVNIFGKTWYEKHFTVNSTPHPTHEFTTLLEQSHLPIAASTISTNAAEPLRMKDGFKSLEQSMYTYAHAYRMDIDEFRELYLMSLVPGSNATAMKGIVDKLMKFDGMAVDGVKARLDAIILGALSNEGKFTFTKDLDPQSPFIGKTIDFGMDATHCAEVGSGNTWVAANKGTVDPLAVIDEVCRRSNVTLNKILTDKETLYFILSTTAMKNYINSVQTVNQPLTPAMLNNFLTANGLPTIEVVERKIRVQDGLSTAEVTPWKAGKLLFVPSDNFGTIETGMTDREMGFASEGVKYSNYGRVELAHFSLGERENTSYAEITKAKMIAIPSIDGILDMWSVDVTK